MQRRLILPLVIIVFGCGARELPKVRVHGQILFDGLPLRDGVIAFTPDKERSRQSTAARAMIYPDGRFMFTSQGEAVLAPGWYRVTIASLTATRLPKRYQDPEVSELMCEIQPGRDNEVNFQIDSRGS